MVIIMNLNLSIIRSPIFKLFIKLGFTDKILDIYWGKNNKSEWAKIKDTGIIEKPYSVWFEPTMRCNLQCEFCHQRERRRISKYEMNIKEIEYFFKQVAEWGIKLIELIGGEIFVRKDFFEILDLIEKYGLKVKLGTNGTLLSQSIIEKLKKYSCIESLSVSIDGPPNIHNKLRGHPKAFELSVNALKQLSKGKFITVIYAVILPENFDNIDFLINLAKELNIDRLTFMPEMFYTKEEIEVTKKYLSLDESERIFVEQRDNINQHEYVDDVIKVIDKIKSIRTKKGVFVPIYPRVSYKYPKDFFLKTLHTKKQLICKHFYSLTVIENGDVLICPFIHRKMGNILQENIEEIWNNEQMREMRRQILKANLLPICKKCCAIDYI